MNWLLWTLFLAYARSSKDAPVPQSRVLQVEQRVANERLDRLSEENSRRFEKVGERFPLLQDDINRRFKAVNQQTLTISKTLASFDGKMDVLLDHGAGCHGYEPSTRSR